MACHTKRHRREVWLCLSCNSRANLQGLLSLGQKIEQVKDTKKLYATFDEYDKIHKILGVENLASLNKITKSGKSGELIRVSEALHEKKIANIADMIASDRRRRLVLIAGPSSSGKTHPYKRTAVLEGADCRMVRTADA